MKDLKAYIESGILEAYVLGSLSEAECAEVSELIAKYPDLQAEIEAISFALEQLAFDQAIEPDPSVKPFLIATIDFMERMEGGEAPGFPPTMNEDSRIEHFEEWISRPDMVLKGKLDGIFAKIIGYAPTELTAIVWIETMTIPEIHTDEYEKFLILEGTCDVHVGDKIHHLKSGDFFPIPLFENHYVKVTSSIPCKAILQRTAA